MVKTNFPKARKVPTKVTTRKSQPTTTNFAKGIYTYKANDAMGLDEIMLAQNARFDRVGEYKTRLGLHALSRPIGIATGSVTGEYDEIELTPDNTIIIERNPDRSVHVSVYSVKVKIRAATEDDFGVVKATCYDDQDNVIAVSCCEIKRTTFEPLSDQEFVFKEGVSLDNNYDVYVRFEPQDNPNHKYMVEVEPNTTTIKTYVRSGSALGYIESMFEANIEETIDERAITKQYLLFVFVPENGTGRKEIHYAELGAADWDTYSPFTYMGLIRELPEGAKEVRFSQDGNKIRYADGIEGPRLIDPSNNWTDSAITTVDLKTGTDLQIKVSNIMTGPQDNIIYFDAETNTQAVWTYPYGYINNNTPINSYDKFDRDFRQNFPAIKTGEPITAMFNLGGIVYFLTRRNKYYLYMQAADSFRPYTATAQHGTFSQESCVCDLNYAYYACDDGIYRFDGSSEVSLTKDTIQNTYDELKKPSTKLQLFNNRLYVFINKRCLVYNINLGLWESFDTGISVMSSVARESVSNHFICGSNKFNQVFLYENMDLLKRDPYNPTQDGASATDSDYSDLGAPIDFDLETSYLHFGTPSQLHRITKWRPEFATVKRDYSVKCGYALDFSDEVGYAFSINLKNKKVLYEDGYIWDNPFSYGSNITPTKLTTVPQVNGQFYRCQIRYQLHGAFTPVNFKSHTLSVETQRLR